MPLAKAAILYTSLSMSTPQEIETTKGIPGFEAVIALAVVAMAALVARKL